MGIGALFGFLDKLMGKLPIQERTERWKNQIDQLEKEKAELLKGSCDAKKAKRITDIDNRLDELYGLCKNKVNG